MHSLIDDHDKQVDYSFLFTKLSPVKTHSLFTGSQGTGVRSEDVV